MIEMNKREIGWVSLHEMKLYSKKKINKISINN